MHSSINLTRQLLLSVSADVTMTQRTSISPAFLGVLLLWASGCSPFVHSPPGRLLALDTARALEKGETGIQVVGGGGGEGDLAFGGAAVQVRHGVGKNLDLRFNVSALKLAPDERLIGSEGVFSAGTGIKYAFNPYFAFSVDVTGGGWQGGGFVSPELKLIAAYENSAAVPFVDVGYYTSHPISVNDVSTTETFLGAPTFTQGWTVGTGVRIVTSSASETGCCRIASALIVGARFTGAYFDNDAEALRRTYGSGTIGFEIVVP